MRYQLRLSHITLPQRRELLELNDLGAAMVYKLNVTYRSMQSKGLVSITPVLAVTYDAPRFKIELTQMGREFAQRVRHGTL